MRLPTAVTAAGAALLAVACFGSDAVPPRPSPATPYMAEVVVVRARQACFAATVRVTGFLVARAGGGGVARRCPACGSPRCWSARARRSTPGRNWSGLTRLPDDTARPDAAPQTITLKSPVAGLVMRSSAVVGAMASAMPGEPLFRIAIDGEIELEVEVPSVHVPELASGQTARVELESGQELSGSIRLVPAAIDQRTQLGRARLSLEKHPALRFGMFARAIIDASRSCGLSVPRSAVQYRTEGASVQMVRENVIETRRVQLGFHSDYDMEIRDGLREGSLVVANAGSSLRDGDKVKPVLSDAMRSRRP